MATTEREMQLIPSCNFVLDLKQCYQQKSKKKNVRFQPILYPRLYWTLSYRSLHRSDRFCTTITHENDWLHMIYFRYGESLFSVSFQLKFE